MRSSVIKRTLGTLEVVTSGCYYSLRYVSLGVGFPNDVVCGAELFYTTAG
jgi:hypothetical protein